MPDVLILLCPFCSGEAELKEYTDHWGSGEYANSTQFRQVICKSCKASAPAIRQKHFIELSDYSVEDFRNNPSLRAKVDDEYDAYKKTVGEEAIEAWNKRTGAQDA